MSLTEPEPVVRFCGNCQYFEPGLLEPVCHGGREPAVRAAAGAYPAWLPFPAGPGRDLTV